NLQTQSPSVTDSSSHTSYASQLDLNAAYVNPHELATTAWIVYGTDTSFGKTNYYNMGSGNGDNLLSASLTGLKPATTYYYRTFATNTTGVVRYGEIQSATTTSPAEATLSVTNNGAQLSFTLSGSAQATYRIQSTPTLSPANW